MTAKDRAGRVNQQENVLASETSLAPVNRNSRMAGNQQGR
jgi:hypothetical protein